MNGCENLFTPTHLGWWMVVAVGDSVHTKHAEENVGVLCFLGMRTAMNLYDSCAQALRDYRTTAWLEKRSGLTYKQDIGRFYWSIQLVVLCVMWQKKEKREKRR